MEALLQNLQEQQLHLQQQHLYINDLTNMENLNDREPPLPPPRKYVSIFRIDGEPILPPLMTMEKRRQMQNLKEKALKIEDRLKERKQRVLYENGLIYENIQSVNCPYLSHYTAGNISQRSEEFYESKHNETAESMALLKNIIQKQQEESKQQLACNTSKHFPRDDNQEKLQKLQKSELLIYDNSTNKVIQVPAEKQKTNENQRTQFESQINLVNVVKKKPSHLLLAGVNSKAIPSICLNPPTPLAININMCETFSTAESSESLIVSENKNKSLDLGEDLSSDESFSSMITHSDKTANRNTSRHIKKLDNKDECAKNLENIPLTPTKNVSAKIQRFEAISSDTNTPQTSPENLYKTRKAFLGPTSGTMNRSATSPSIKLSTSNRSSSSRSQSLAQDSDNSPENTLVRSSSFTLEGPSEALIEHMQQQRVNTDIKAAVKSSLNTTRTLTKKSIASPLRAHRDTVESKAKRVQKVELKSSKIKIQHKTSQSKLAQAAAASILPYNNTALNQHTHNFCKTKRSPYDISKSSHNSLLTLQKTSATQMRKSNSTSSNLVQSKSCSKSRLTSTPVQSSASKTCSSARTPQRGKESFKQMDTTKKDKFLQLLAQQDEEHRRLQQSFEMQQKLLIEQLNQEMAASHLKSPNNASYLKTMTQQKGVEQQKNQINSTGFSLDSAKQNHVNNTFDCKLPKTETNQQHQSSPSSISNNSSYRSIAKHQLHTNNSPCTSYNTHYSQSSHDIPLNNSHLSFMDHSNANTSLDISTLSTQTLPDTLCTTPTIQNNANKTSSSSLRRRLFTTEINDAGSEGNAQSARSTASSLVSLGQLFVEKGQLNHSNKSPLILTNNDSNRRPPVEDTFILHAAATKINACARGFLVRRLFQTEQIQRIVQTIRDTLIFVLNLHIETMEDPEESHTPANIKLKARLLQQLSSACRTLHLVFFQTSVKERMEIIARDRKRIKTKLMSKNHKR